MVEATRLAARTAILLAAGLLSAQLIACGGDDESLSGATETPELAVESCFPSPGELGNPGPMTEEVVDGVTISTAARVASEDRERIVNGLRAARQFVDREFGGVRRVVCLEIRADNRRSGSAITLRNRIIVFTETDGWGRPYPWLLSRATAHEYIHVWATETADDFALANAPDYGPGWLTEGVPEYLSMRIVLDAGLAPVDEAETFTNTLLRLSSVTLSGLEALPLPSPEDYALAELAVSRLVGDNDYTRIESYYVALGMRVPWQSAFQDAFGMLPQRFIADFEASMTP